MIETLRIEGVKIVEEAELEFGPGLNVLTGETGAGKSIIVDALGLAAGDRADSAAIRRGAERAILSARASTVAVPDALSSAPLYTRPPSVRPRWS